MLRKLQSVSSSKGGVVRILIIGGTRCLGRHLVEAALARNHEVTLFNRGKSNPISFRNLETILGDRDTCSAPATMTCW